VVVWQRTSCCLDQCSRKVPIKPLEMQIPSAIWIHQEWDGLRPAMIRFFMAELFSVAMIAMAILFRFLRPHE